MENCNEEIIKDPYGFVYITTNLINGKRYIGAKKFDSRNVWKNYLGSGKAFSNALDKYGKENFIKEIISIHYSYEELFNAEEKMIKFCNATKSDNYYNISDGQYSDNWASYTEFQRKQLTDKMKERNYWNRKDEEAQRKQIEMKEKYLKEFSGEGNPFYGKKHSQESLDKMSKSHKGKTCGDKNGKYWKGKISPNKGKKMSQEAKNKMSDSAKKRIINKQFNNSYYINIILNKEKYCFNCIKDCYDFCVINNLIPNKRQPKQIHIHMDIFRKRLKENYKFELFDYYFPKKDGYI